MPAPKPIDRYLPDLAAPDLKTRREAVKGLRQSRNPAALPHLLNALHDEAASVLVHAIRGLAELGDPAAIPALLRRLERATCDVCDEVGDALVSFGEAAVQPLLDALSATHPRVRAIAITCLSHLRPPEAAPRIAALLTDPSPMVITSALRALWGLADPRTREPLAAFIAAPPAEDTFERQREAAFALAELGDERALAVLAGSFTYAGNRRCIDTIRQLGKLGSAHARTLIQAYLDEDPESTCASQARATLAQLG